MQRDEGLNDRAKAGAVEESPHDRGDDAWHRIGDEEREPEEAPEPDERRIHQEGQQQRENHLDGNLHRPEDDDALDAIPEGGIMQRFDIVLGP